MAVSASPWFSRVWRADDGLPGDNVTGVVQTPDGYLWIATQTGLAQFDGLKIKNISLPGDRPHPIIRALQLDRAGQLWLALEGGAVMRWSPQATEIYTATNGLPKSQPQQIVQTGDDAIWISYLDGSVCRIAGGTVTRFAESAGLAGGAICTLTSDPQGRLWFGQGGRVGMFTEEKFKTLLTLNLRFAQVQAAREKGIWICAGDRLLKYETGTNTVELGRIVGESPVLRSLSMLEDRAGVLWIGTSMGGLFRYDGKAISRITTSHGRIQAITEDREGNIWVGTEGGGLNRLRPQVVELQGRDAGLPFETVRSVCEETNGTIWAVTQNGEVSINNGSGWQSLAASGQWPGGQATCVAHGADGIIYIGTVRRGVYRWRGGKFLPRLRTADGLANSGIRSFLPDSRGNLWIAFSEGNVLQRFCDDQFQDYSLPAGSRAVRTIVEDAAGKIWMANLSAQLLRVDGDRIVDETTNTPGPYHPIRCLTSTADGSLWIGYSAAGVGRLRAGRYSRVGKDQGLHDDSICSLMPDSHGWMWIGADHGIFRVSQKELTGAADGKIAAVQSFRYGRDDGLPSVQAYYGYAPGAARTRDGRILLPTRSGLAIVHPDRVQTATLRPPVIIEGLVVDHQTVNLDTEKPTVRLSPSHHKIEFSFTAPSFIEPEQIRFRYQLVGWEDEWVEVAAGGERQVVYPRLPAGHYHFQVAAGSRSEGWSASVATFDLEVQPFFWQTGWFSVAAAALFTAALLGLARYFSFRRLRLKLRRLEQENALQKERARIAQDIHDDLGASLTQISLLAELTRQAIAQPEKAGEHVAQIAWSSRMGIKSLDEIVWAVNPRNDTLADLLDYAGQYAVDFLHTAGIRCRVDFPDVPPHEFSGEVRHGLFLAVREALNNVVKHAHATEVRLSVAVAGEALRLTIEDNGRGFASPPGGALADGLRNMQTRLAGIGGLCSIEGRPGTGVRITFEMPCLKR